MLLPKFKHEIKQLLNDRFDNIPINIYVILKGNKFIVNIEDDDQCVEFDRFGNCCTQCDDLTEDVVFLCKQCIDKYKNDYKVDVLNEDGECCVGGGDVVSGDNNVADGGVENSTTEQPNEPEINSNTVGKGCYVAYVCPGALSRRMFNKYYYNYNKKKKRKEK